MTQQQNSAFLIGPEVEMRGLGDVLAAHGIRVYGMAVTGRGTLCPDSRGKKKLEQDTRTPLYYSEQT